MRRGCLNVLAGALALLAYSTAEAQSVKVGNVYCYSGGTFHWKVFIDERPEVLRNIRCAVYSLYSTFPNPTREVCDAATRFTLEESGRGEFAMPVKVEWLNGTAADQLYTLDLHSSNRNQPALCSIPIDPLWRDVRPIGLTLLSSNLVILDGHSGRLLQKQPAGIRNLASLGDITAINIAGTQLDASHEAIFAIKNLDGGGELLMYSDTGARAHKVWTSPQPAAREFTGIAADSVTRSIYLAAPAPGLGSSQILRLDLSKGISNAHLVSLGAIVLPESPAVIGPIAVDGSKGRLFAIDKYQGILVSVDIPVEGGAPVFYTEKMSVSHSLHDPRALAVDPANNILYAIAEHKVWKLQVQGTSASMQQLARKTPSVRRPH